MSQNFKIESQNHIHTPDRDFSYKNFSKIQFHYKKSKLLKSYQFPKILQNYQKLPIFKNGQILKVFQIFPKKSKNHQIS